MYKYACAQLQSLSFQNLNEIGKRAGFRNKSSKTHNIFFNEYKTNVNDIFLHFSRNALLMGLFFICMIDEDVLYHIFIFQEISTVFGFCLRVIRYRHMATFKISFLSDEIFPFPRQTFQYLLSNFI